MKALVLCAGDGTRLRPLAVDRPKPMVPIGGRPVLEHILAFLRRNGVRQVAINLHYRPEPVVQHFGDGRQYGMAITYSYEPVLLGTAGAAKRLERIWDGTFMVVYGDVLLDVDIRGLVELHRERKSLGTIALYRVSEPTRCGIVELAHDGRVLRFVEKPGPEEVFSDLANAGLYILEPEILSHVPVGCPLDFAKDLFPILLARGLPIHGSTVRGYVMDIGASERYFQALEDWRGGRLRSWVDSGPGAETGTVESTPC